VSERPDDGPVGAWRDWAMADAERRGLPQLATLIEGLATTIARLRAGDWNDDAARGTGPAKDNENR
jgi:hypothetical protein